MVLRPALLIALSVLGNSAYAVPCSDLSTGVFDNAADMNSISSACIDGLTNNDDTSQLNAGNFFGINTWSQLGKEDDNGTTGSINLDVQHIGDVDGTFSFDLTVWDNNDEVVVVLKDGGTGTNNQGPKWSAYLLNQDAFAGFWIYGSGKKGLKELSHLTVYGSGTTVVPVPAAVWLFGTGLLGLVAVARRRQPA